MENETMNIGINELSIDEQSLVSGGNNLEVEQTTPLSTTRFDFVVDDGRKSAPVIDDPSHPGKPGDN